MLIIPAFLESYRSLKDRSLKLVYETNEPTPDQISEISRSHNMAGFLAFNPDPFTTSQEKYIAELDTDYREVGKTPSQRLRGVLYRNYEKENEGYKTFEDYYRSKMEVIITHFKGKLD
jgi:hypothetical protein